MAPEAIVLLVAGDAAFQVLSGCLGVAENPEGLAVVERGHHVSLALNTRTKVTFPTKGFRVVAGGTVAYPAVSLRPVGGHEI